MPSTQVKPFSSREEMVEALKDALLSTKRNLLLSVGVDLEGAKQEEIVLRQLGESALTDVLESIAVTEILVLPFAIGAKVLVARQFADLDQEFSGGEYAGLVTAIVFNGRSLKVRTTHVESFQPADVYKLV
jgi:hypothetical protein